MFCMSKKIFGFISSIYLIFNIQLNIFPDGIGKLVYHLYPVIIILLCPSAVFFVYKFFNKTIYLKYAFVIFVFCFSWAVWIFAYNLKDISFIVYLLNTVSSLLRFIALAILMKICFPRDKVFVSFSNMFIFCNIIYVLSSIILLLDANIKDIWSSLIIVDVDLIENKGDLLLNSTRYGLAGYSGFNNTIFCSIAVWLSLYLAESKVGIRNFLYTMCVGILLCGNMMYGRSGLIISIFMLVFFFFHKFSIRKLVAVTSLIGFSSICLYGIVLYSDINPLVSTWVTWIMEPLNAFGTEIEHGRISFGDSGNELVDNMYFLPSDDLTIFFGDGMYTTESGGYYMSTDSGFMRQMLYFGIIGMTLSYGTMFFMLLSLYYFLKKNLYYAQGYCSLFLIMFIFMELKGMVYNLYFGVLVGLIVSMMLDFINTEER